MGSLLAETIPLALAGAVSPILFVEVLAVISGPQRLRRGLAFAAGATIPLIAVATLVLLAGDAVSLPKSPTAPAVIDIVLGAALLAFGASALFHAPRHKEAGAGRQPSKDPKRTFVFGIGSMTTNVTTLAFFIPAVKQIGSAEVAVEERLLVTALTILIVLAPALVPLAAATVAPDASTRALTGLRDFLHDRGRGLRIVLGVGFGVWLLAKGIGELS